MVPWSMKSPSTRTVVCFCQDWCRWTVQTSAILLGDAVWCMMETTWMTTLVLSMRNCLVNGISLEISPLHPFPTGQFLQVSRTIINQSAMSYLIPRRYPFLEDSESLRVTYPWPDKQRRRKRLWSWARDCQHSKTASPPPLPIRTTCLFHLGASQGDTVSHLIACSFPSSSALLLPTWSFGAAIKGAGSRSLLL